MGLIEMRNARMRGDGVIETGMSLRRQRNFWFLNWQALPFLEATFRVTDRLNGTLGRGRSTDRSFDLRARLWTENDWRPALAVGVQDVIGTGIYAGEYIVGSKRFWGVDVSLGMGWGRLATGSDIDNPLGVGLSAMRTRPRNVGEGGVPNLRSLFRGPRAGIFGGIEWNVPAIGTPLGELSGLSVKVEYSADALRDERGGYPARSSGLLGRAASRVNAGVQWRNEHFDIGASFVNGTDFLARASIRLDPHDPPRLLDRAPPAMAPRPAPVEGFSNESVAAGLFPALRRAGFEPLALDIRGEEAVITLGGGRYRTLAQVAGRVARAAQPHLPGQVERLQLIWEQNGAVVGRLRVMREGMEGLARGQGSPEEVFGAAQLLPATPEPGGWRAPLPRWSWGIEPRVTLQVGDARSGARYAAGVAAGGRVEIAHGIALAGSVQQTLAQNLDGGLPSNSVLPHVRSDFARYARHETTIPALYAERLWNPAPDWYARVTAGLLEPMYAGVSGEVLWRPQGSSVAVGLDMAWVAQRQYRQRFATLGYQTVTGHASLYWDTPWWNVFTVVRAGRYLAGDWGVTLEAGRRFANGIEIGGFATFTDVPFRRFGEGSFDKGIYVRVPFDVFGPETRARAALNVRPVQRDGGQRLGVDNPLWDVSREGRAEALGRGFLGFAR
ncbi:hypothetical protein EOD42_09695 [Rhodovarius crocodyli]|uniref:YjbH domain-containing protein n=2 Tax=Rhodovarius crocodyli TaxID=1979269 RepID=A0A437MHK4_9PROT|nr:hypothetical protein EOD42_09695 [Rhodovarius crocodyli]